MYINDTTGWKAQDDSICVGQCVFIIRTRRDRLDVMGPLVKLGGQRKFRHATRAHTLYMARISSSVAVFGNHVTLICAIADGDFHTYRVGNCLSAELCEDLTPRHLVVADASLLAASGPIN